MSKEKIILREDFKFILEEFNQCYEHMRHYDNVKLSLAKFGFSFYSAIATISFVLERYFYIEKSINSVHLFLAGLLCLAYIIGIMLIYMFLQNRLYFVRVARQTNSIRKVFLSQLNFEFKGFLSTDPLRPYPLNFKSTHLLLILLFILINSIMVGFALAFGLLYLGISSTIVIVTGLLVFLGSIISLISFTKNMLSKTEEI
jgi:hypothetical protein